MSDTQTHRDTARDSTPVAGSDIETMHDVLSDWERRAILYSLQAHDGTATADEVVTDIVGWRRGQPTPDPPNEDVAARVRDRISREHLRKLDEFGVLDYDPERNEIRLDEEMRIAISEPWLYWQLTTPRSPRLSREESGL